ncbi:MAG TPA: hypothetical protein PLA43_07225 [Bryobacteraceae bacterium]|nr:hypothetical protein [Bryobacteraceae bacterium]HOL70104.1 hypothetical protein [Bryobacteraceae bacterium]HOQ43826.1 hypothetical protein [Bryobacteraceae bacterium]HPQ14700.1 hypothetical protein [Bryobacteraceae bacterium]HPU71731.1 hypothetical protein [Bryobacteraceae bacterium]
MFESLDDRIKRTEMDTSSPLERLLKVVLALVVTVLVLGGLYVAVRMVE